MHLQKCVDVYSKNLSKDSEIHKLSNVQIMRQNVDLIFAIKNHRTKLHNAKFKKDDTTKNEKELQSKKKII